MSTTGTTLTITEEQARFIFVAQVHGSYGSAERLRVKEDLGKAFQATQDGKRPESVKIEVTNQELKAWAAGCINGWKSEVIPTQTGPMPMSDVDRNIIRLSAKAMRVWETVKKQLPAIEEGEFEIDPDLADEIKPDEVFA